MPGYSLVKWQVIAPPPWRTVEVQKALMRALEDEAREMQKQFAKTVATWSPENRPGFKAEITMSASGSADIEISVVGTDKQIEIYNFVDRGTKPHIIRPRKGKVLAFGVSPYKQSKTVPGQMRSRSGWRKKFWGRTPGVKMVYAQKVNHPGTEPRDFSRVVRQKRRAAFERNIKRAFEEGIKRMT